VLIAGGGSGGSFLDTAELYNPLKESFEPLSEEMKVTRYLAVATPLPNGKVLIAGGYTGSAYLSSAELYNPTTGSFESITATDLPTGSGYRGNA
jgi:hypothetical protein